MPFHCREEDGILIIQATGVLRVEDVPDLTKGEEHYFASPDCRGLMLCDCRDLKVISPDGADALVDRMRVDNPRIVKSAYVVAEGTAALQLKRMIRDAAGGNRAVFANEAQARAWLGARE
jgi:hypothetical protein